MFKRTTRPVLMLALFLLGAAFAPSAPGDRPAGSAIQQPATKSMTLAGIVEVDETKLVLIAAKVKGRIDKLHVKFAGQKVKPGEPLADLSSRELLVAVQNLLDARKNGNQDLERMVRDLLTLWGMDKDQVEEILKSGKPIGEITVRAPMGGHLLRKHQMEGAYVEVGASFFDMTDLSTVWIEAEINDQAVVPILKAKLPVAVTVKAVPNVEFLGLFQDAKTRVLKVRIAVKNPGDELRPGMLALVILDVSAGQQDKSDAKLKELLKERLATLRSLVKLVTAEYQSGKVSMDRVHQATTAMLQAQLELCESDKERIAVLEEGAALAKGEEKMAMQRYQTGNASQSDALMATAARLEAEIALERAKTAAPARPK
jgi:Barrel-sandwich domain of CusB or HlyD membrane-fusion